MTARRKSAESGEMMLEGVFAVLATLFVLIFMLSFCTFLYQRTILKIMTNEVAEEMVLTYRYPGVTASSDITREAVVDRKRFRGASWAKSAYQSANQTKVQTLSQKRFPQTSFALSSGSPTAVIKTVEDDIGRQHYEVTVTSEYSYLLGDLLKLVGQDRTQQVTAKVYVEAVDVSGYVNSVKARAYIDGKIDEAFPVFKAVSSVINLVSKVFHMINE